MKLEFSVVGWIRPKDNIFFPWIWRILLQLVGCSTVSSVCFSGACSLGSICMPILIHCAMWEWRLVQTSGCGTAGFFWWSTSDCSDQLKSAGIEKTPRPATPVIPGNSIIQLVCSPVEGLVWYLLLPCVLHSSGYFICFPSFTDRKPEVSISTTASVSSPYKSVLKFWINNLTFRSTQFPVWHRFNITLNVFKNVDLSCLSLQNLW